MSTTFATLKTRTLLLLNDDACVAYAGSSGSFSGSPTTSGSLYSAELLEAAAFAALDAILPWIWKRKIQALTGGSISFDLPSDFYRVEAVVNLDTGENIPSVVPSQGAFWGDGFMEGNGWILYPSGSIVFSTALSSTGGSLLYSALWGKPTLDADVLEAPDNVVTALTLFMASYCALPKAYQSAFIRQYGTKVDSGTPTDNPLMDMSNYFMKRFEIEVGRLPMISRGER